jgi:hypothetical protein
VIRELTRYCPEIVLSQPENLDMLISQGQAHVQHDKFVIRVQIANAWSNIYELAKQRNQQQILNKYFVTVMQSLHTLLRLEESVQRNCFQAITNCFNTCLESCDSANLKQPLYALLETLLGQIGELYSCPDAFGTHNKESKEIFMNNYCSAA